MSDIIVLDTGVLGMLVHPAQSGEPWECKTWLKRVVLGGASVYVPEIVDYELRRELLRIKSSASIKRLDALKSRLRYVPITTEAMLKAAEFWAAARNAGQPTADEKALDVDVILAAQSTLLAQSGDQVIVATTPRWSSFTIPGRTVVARDSLNRQPGFRNTSLGTGSVPKGLRSDVFRRSRRR